MGPFSWRDRGALCAGLASPAARGRAGAMRGPLLSTLLLAALSQVRPGSPTTPSPRGCGDSYFLRSEIKRKRRWGKRRDAFLVEILADEQGAIFFSKSSPV